MFLSDLNHFLKNRYILKTIPNKMIQIWIVLCSCCIFIWFVLYSRGCGNNEEYVLDEVEEGEIDLGVYECSSEEEEGEEEEGESIYNLDRTEVLKIYTNTEI